MPSDGVILIDDYCEHSWNSMVSAVDFFVNSNEYKLSKIVETLVMIQLI
ncbi:MAG: hypothetical protein KatS3mg109_2066 [Pirellulaceae bacterium]|nr:MAG: hypothetical protein KatS3mg109_2066 [Pirellulaceae bacterium]